MELKEMNMLMKLTNDDARGFRSDWLAQSVRYFSPPTISDKQFMELPLTENKNSNLTTNPEFFSYPFNDCNK